MRFIGVALVSLLALISVGTAFADIPVQTCIVLSHNLSAGASDSSAGGDVSALQAYLNQQNYLSTSAVGIFGPKTYAAVKSFQVAHGLPATGYVGPLTRAVLNCGTQTLLPPTSVSGSGTSVTSSSSSNSNNPAPQLQALAPSSGTVGTSVTLYGSGFASDNKILFDNRFLVHASSADASTLTFTVPNAFRPDCLAGQPCPQWLQPLGAKTYNVSVETNGGTSNSLPFMVTEATSGNQPSISLTYPRGGQVLDDSPSTSGSAKTLATITWTTTNFGSLSVGISLKDTNGDYLKAIATNIPNTGSYTWMQDSSIPNGKYKIDIYSADKGPSADDLGDYIQIVNSPLGTPSNPSIVIEDPRNGNGYDIGTWAYIPTYWNESGFTPKNIQIYLDGSFVGVAPILVATLGASTATHYDVPIPANTPSGHLYAITVCDNGTVNPSTGKPICDISDDFTITNNGSATTGSGLTVSGGAQPASGYASIGLLAPFINFTLSSGGASATVNSIQVQRTGASTDADLTDVYVVDTANGLTIGRGTLNTNHIATISFQTPVTISAGSSHSFTVYGDIAPSASVGHVLSLALTSVSANVSEVHGSLPISGATFSLQQPTNPPNQGAVPSCFLSALPVTLPVGGIYTLSWNASQNTTSSTIVLNGGQITITPGAGNYNGSQQFSPVGTWVMTVSNAYGKNTCQTIVTNSANATVPPPVVTSVSPLQAAVGASAIVYGNNFVNVSSIDFYDVHNQFAGRIYPTNNALNVDGDGMQIQFTVPSSITPGNYSIKVVTSWGTSNGSPFSVQSPATTSPAPYVPPGYGYIQCASEGGHCTLPSGMTADVIYGAAGWFNYQNGVSGGIDCNNSVFGDPAVGYGKTCFYKSASAPATSPVVGYTLCAKETQFCSFAGTKDVAYGWNDSFTYKTGVTGGIQCDNTTLGTDPKYGFGKACYIKDSAATPQPASGLSISSINPVAATPGTSVTIYGSGFDEQTYVSFANVPTSPNALAINPTSFTSGSLTFTLPGNASAGTFSVYAAERGTGAISNGVSLTVSPALPIIAPIVYQGTSTCPIGAYCINQPPPCPFGAYCVPKPPTGISAGSVLGASTYQFTRLLSLGSSGEDVTALQELLAGLGFFSETPTGYFGADTQAAVTLYQSRNGIPAVGVVGPLTRTKLNGQY